MDIAGRRCLITGSDGALRRGLAVHLESFGARVLAGEEGRPEYLFHVAEAPPLPRAEHDLSCCEREVTAPLLTAARLAPGLRYACLIRAAAPEPGRADAAHALSLEASLAGLAEESGLPFAVLRGRAGGPKAGGVAAMAAYAARARLRGVIDLDRGRA